MEQELTLTYILDAIKERLLKIYDKVDYVLLLDTEIRFDIEHKGETYTEKISHASIYADVQMYPLEEVITRCAQIISNKIFNPD